MFYNQVYKQEHTQQTSHDKNKPSSECLIYQYFVHETQILKMTFCLSMLCGFC